MTSSFAKQVASCNRRARDQGLAHTLTTLDWQRTLDFFKHHCVYCGGGAWTIDHFQSLANGGGSTVIFSWVPIISFFCNLLVSSFEWV